MKMSFAKGRPDIYTMFYYLKGRIIFRNKSVQKKGGYWLYTDITRIWIEIFIFTGIDATI